MLNAGDFKLINLDSQEKEPTGTVKEYEIQGFLNDKEKKEPKGEMGSYCPDSKEDQFSILPIVGQYQEMKAQEKEKYEKRIEEIVRDKVKDVEKEAYSKGLEMGREEAIRLMKEELQEGVRGKVEALGSYIQKVKGDYEELISCQKEKIYDMLKSLTKWVILRELKDDEKYIERLLEKLLLDINSNTNLILKVDKKIVEEIPDVFQAIEEKFDHLSTIRIEPLQRKKEEDFEKGVILESENVILDATFETQLKSLDKLFAQLGPYENK